MSIDAASPPWSAVIFDLDGTLVDTVDLIVASFQHAFSEVAQVQVTRADATAWIGRPLREVLQARDPARADALFASYLAYNRANSADMIRPFPGVLELVEDLARQSIATAVATSKGRESARLALEMVGLADHLPTVVALEDTARHKPYPDPLIEALARIDAAAAQACYVGDAPVDIEAARAAGMASVAVTYGAGHADHLAGADCRVSSVTELRAALFGTSVSA